MNDITDKLAMIDKTSQPSEQGGTSTNCIECGFSKSLLGYKATGKVIAQKLNAAQVALSKVELDGTFESAKARGYFEGLLFAHAMLALGEFPEVTSNQKQIAQILSS